MAAISHSVYCSWWNGQLDDWKGNKEIVWHVECKDDTTWMQCYTMMEADELIRLETKGRHNGMASEGTNSFGLSRQNAQVCKKQR